MSHTPDIIVIKWRKLLHDFFASAGALILMSAIVGFITGQDGAFALVLSLLSFAISAKIKFKLVKRAEAARYELV